MKDNPTIAIALIVLVGGCGHLVLSGRMPGVKYSKDFGCVENAPISPFFTLFLVAWMALIPFVLVGWVKFVPVAFWIYSLITFLYAVKAIAEGTVRYAVRYGLEPGWRWKALYFIKRKSDPIPYWVGICSYLLLALGLASLGVMIFKGI